MKKQRNIRLQSVMRKLQIQEDRELAGFGRHDVVLSRFQRRRRRRRRHRRQINLFFVVVFGTLTISSLSRLLRLRS